MSYLEVNGLTVGYGKGAVLKDLSFAAEKGTLNGILGANGCGKTTALKAICGILPHDGTCLLDGIPLETLSVRRISQMCSYIPQKSGITVSISALDAVLMGFNPRLGLLEYPSTAMKQQAMEALSAVGLSGRENDDFQTFSEGQKQLCMLARTLVSDAKLLLLDEPESALDFRHRYAMMNVLRDQIRSSDKTALITLHDSTLALNFCDRLLLIADGALCGILSPREDPPEKMETALSRIYGSISLHRCRDRGGRAYLVMIREDS